MPVHTRVETGGVHAIGQDGDAFRRHTPSERPLLHGCGDRDNVVGAAQSLGLRFLRQGFQTEAPEAFLFLNQRRIHFEHARNLQRLCDIPAGPVKERIALVDRIGLQARFVQRR